jgi:hypothetical protein
MVRQKLFLPLVVLFVVSASAQAGLTKSLFSEPSGSIGLQVTQDPMNANLFYLTFVPQEIDSGILNDAISLSDPSIGWSVFFGPLAINRLTRQTYVAGPATVVTYVVTPLPNTTTLTVADSTLTTHLTGTIHPALLITGVGAQGGMMQADDDLTNVSVPNAGGSPVYQEFANYSFLTWGFTYAGLDLDAYLQSPPAHSGFAATAGYIMTPEPVTLGLMAIGFAAILARRRR